MTELTQKSLEEALNKLTELQVVAIKPRKDGTYKVVDPTNNPSPGPAEPKNGENGDI